MAEWDGRQCVLCAARGREVRLGSGHVCAACTVRIADDLGSILRLAAYASASLVPSGNAGGYGAAVFGSKPPLDVSALDPELTLVRLVQDDPSSTVTILEMLEAWERCIRQDRGFIPYGPASASRSFSGVATLTGVVSFLQGQHEWVTTEVTFCIEDYAGQVHRAQRALGRFDVDRVELGQMVKCPTLFDDGECGYRLHYAQADEQVTCKRCGMSRDVATLVAVAMSDGKGEIWIDPEAASHQCGVDQMTLKKWARRGHVVTSHGRYELSSIHRAINGESA